MTTLSHPDQLTIGQHLRERHGLTIPETVGPPQVTLLAEHAKYHARLVCDHDHQRPTEGSTEEVPSTRR